MDTGYYYKLMEKSEHYHKWYYDHDHDLACRSNGEKTIYSLQEIVELGETSRVLDKY